MSPFFTRSGDDGTTGILGEGRVPKNDLRLEALGALDEVNAALGLARAMCQSVDTAAWIVQIQRDLYGLMGEVAATAENAPRFRRIDAGKVAWLEQLVEKVSQEVAVPEEFILPGDTLPGAALDLARTVVRRAERRLVDLSQRGDLENPHLLEYINRLSSFCFIAELLENQTGGKPNPTLAKDPPAA